LPVAEAELLAVTYAFPGRTTISIRLGLVKKKIYFFNPYFLHKKALWGPHGALVK